MTSSSNIEAYVAVFHRAADISRTNCDCISEELVVELHGIDADPRWGSGVHADLVPLLTALERSRRAKLSKHLIDSLPSAYSATVLTPSCGADKFSVTIFPILDVALKLRPAEPHTVRRIRHHDATETLFAYCPRTLIIEPTVSLGNRTLALLNTTIQEHTLPLRVKAFLDIDSILQRGQLSRRAAVDIGICTPDTAAELVARNILNIDLVQLTFWDSAHELLGRSYTNADPLLLKLSREGKRSIFATTVQHGATIDHIKTSMLRASRIKSKSEFSAIVKQHHRQTESRVRKWERKTSESSLVDDRSSGPPPVPPQPTAPPQPAAPPQPVAPPQPAPPQSAPAQAVAPAVLPFMNFPRAIRERIYRYLVVDSDPMETTTFKIRFESWPSTAGRVSGTQQYKWKYEWYALRKGAVDWLGSVPTINKFAIARANRQLATEVLPIIYGGNTFQFDNVSDLNTFLFEIDTKRSLLRNLRIRDPCGWNTGRNGYSRILFRLWTTMNLKTIEFNTLCVGSTHPPGDDRIQIRTFVEHIRPFLRRWYEVNEAGTGTRRVLDVVQFFEDRQCVQCASRSRICRHDVETQVATVSENFRGLIEEELGLQT